MVFFASISLCALVRFFFSCFLVFVLLVYCYFRWGRCLFLSFRVCCYNKSGYSLDSRYLLNWYENGYAISWLWNPVGELCWTFCSNAWAALCIKWRHCWAVSPWYDLRGWLGIITIKSQLSILSIYLSVRRCSQHWAACLSFVAITVWPAAFVCALTRPNSTSF